MECGRVVCEQEGSGPCFFCGELVCTREEREVSTFCTLAYLGLKTCWSGTQFLNSVFKSKK